MSFTDDENHDDDSDDHDDKISWSCSSWLLAIFVILPLFDMATGLLVVVSYLASFVVAIPILALYFLIVFLFQIVFG